MNKTVKKIENIIEKYYLEFYVKELLAESPLAKLIRSRQVAPSKPASFIKKGYNFILELSRRIKVSISILKNGYFYED